MANIYPRTRHTQGTTYSRAGLIALPAGSWSASATVKTAAGELVEALGVNLSPLSEPDADGNTHAFSIVSDASETALWPLAALLQDVIFTDASLVPVKVPAVTTQILVSEHTPPISAADNPLQVITPELAPVLRGEQGQAGAGARRHASSAPYSYTGTAPAGTADSAAGWTVTRITVAANGTTTVATATGAWTDRASLTYV